MSCPLEILNCFVTIESVVGDRPEGAAREIFMFPQFSPIAGVQGWWLPGDCCSHLGTCSLLLLHSQLCTTELPDLSGIELEGRDHLGIYVQ